MRQVGGILKLAAGPKPLQAKGLWQIAPATVRQACVSPVASLALEDASIGHPSLVRFNGPDATGLLVVKPPRLTKVSAKRLDRPADDVYARIFAYFLPVSFWPKSSFCSGLRHHLAISIMHVMHNYALGDDGDDRARNSEWCQYEHHSTAKVSAFAKSTQRIDRKSV